MSFTEVHGDLFTSSDSLVHCVSRDLHMGKGIATEFKKQFGGLDDLRQQSMLVLFYLIWMLTAFIQIRLGWHRKCCTHQYLSVSFNMLCCLYYRLH